MLVEEQSSFLYDVAQLILYCRRLGFTITGGELWRTPEQQKIYVEAGRSKTFNSYHLKRLAIDLNFFKDGALVQTKADLQPIGDFWESLSPSNSWGGNWNSFKDLPHFERRY